MKDSNTEGLSASSMRAVNWVQLKTGMNSSLNRIRFISNLLGDNPHAERARVTNCGLVTVAPPWESTLFSTASRSPVCRSGKWYTDGAILKPCLANRR